MLPKLKKMDVLHVMSHTLVTKMQISEQDASELLSEILSKIENK